MKKSQGSTQKQSGDDFNTNKSILNQNAPDNFFKKLWFWYKQYREKQKIKKQKPMTFQESVVSWVKTIVGAIIVVMIINGLAIASFVVPTGSMENTVMTGDFLFVNKFIYGPSTPQVVPFLNIPLPFYKFPGFRSPRKGDVIVFIYPGDRDELESHEFQYYLKRCIAAPGDTLVIHNKHVFVNGNEQPLAPHGKYLFPVNNMNAPFPKGRNYTADNYGPLVIPKKGEIVQLTPQNYEEWNTLIKREGHKTTISGNIIKIDDNPTAEYKVQRNYYFAMGDNRDNSQDSRYWGFVPEDNIVGTPIMVYWSWNPEISLLSIVDKISSVRWSRIFNFIK